MSVAVFRGYICAGLERDIYRDRESVNKRDREREEEREIESVSERERGKKRNRESEGDRVCVSEREMKREE